MERTESREVVVKYCDFCGEESKNLTKCAICKKEMCNKDGMKAHADFSIELYRYSDDARLVSGHICKDCGKKEIPATVQELMNEMIGFTPAQAKKQATPSEQLGLGIPEAAEGHADSSTLVR